MNLTLETITHTPGRHYPLHVVFSWGGERHKVPLAAKHLDTFIAFRRHVADVLGLWVRHDDYEAPRRRNQPDCWHAGVGMAFAKGRNQQI